MDKARTVLLVEDNPGDVHLFLEAIKALRLDVRVDVATDGELAVALAQQIDPDLIVLNLNLPRLSGIEVLRKLRSCRGTQSIPAVIYSGTGPADEVTEAYRAGANCVVQKPMTFESYTAAVHDICAFWLERVLLPEHVGAIL